MELVDTKLQRLLARQRALDAQIKVIQNKERERQEQAIAHLIRRHKLIRFDPEKLDQALARVVAELGGAAQQPQAPESEYDK